jgi:hypothetical protein
MFLISGNKYSTKPLRKVVLVKQCFLCDFQITGSEDIAKFFGGFSFLYTSKDKLFVAVDIFIERDMGIKGQMRPRREPSFVGKLVDREFDPRKCEEFLRAVLQ